MKRISESPPRKRPWRKGGGVDFYSKSRTKNAKARRKKTRMSNDTGKGQEKERGKKEQKSQLGTVDGAASLHNKSGKH